VIIENGERTSEERIVGWLTSRPKKSKAYHDLNRDVVLIQAFINAAMDFLNMEKLVTIIYLLQIKNNSFQTTGHIKGTPNYYAAVVGTPSTFVCLCHILNLSRPKFHGTVRGSSQNELQAINAKQSR